MVIIQNYTPKNPISMIGYEAGVCWGADVSNQEKNYKRGLDCIKNEHGRTWEFPDVYATIKGYSAKCLREWYTHIGGSPTRLQASTRYIDYSKGEGFKYTTPPSLKKDKNIEREWEELMIHINDCIKFFIEHKVPIEDATMALPLSYHSSMVDKRNFRNLVDMSHQRKCTRAYWEYRQLFNDYEQALRNYSEEWNTLCDLFIPKCEYFGFCKENKTCGRKPKFNLDNN